MITSVFSVLSRNGALLGTFTDQTMAEQFIDHAYQKVYAQTTAGKPLPTFIIDSAPSTLFEDIKVKGSQRWISDDKNSAAPVFYVLPVLVYNHVPIIRDDFSLGGNDSFASVQTLPLTTQVDHGDRLP